MDPAAFRRPRARGGVEVYRKGFGQATGGAVDRTTSTRPRRPYGRSTAYAWTQSFLRIPGAHHS
jgi:hypothetical protein